MALPGSAGLRGASFSDTEPALTPDTPNTLVPGPSITTSPFRYDPRYSFPPFFTLQPNLTTRAAQLSSWSALLLSYCAHHHLFLFSPTHSIFHNTHLKKRLSPPDIHLLFAFMVDQGRAEWADAAGKSSSKRDTDGKTRKEGENVWIWWKTPEEWAAVIMGWVEETGQKNSVLTFYELREEGGKGAEWNGMPEEVLKRVLQGLVKRGKASVFGEEETLGVKFF